MNNIILICTILIFNVALASEESIFTTLKNWYQDGEKTSIESVKRMYVGRCYDKLQKNVPKNSIIVTQSNNTNFDHGPAFNYENKETQINKFIEFGAINGKNNYFDNIKPQKVDKLLTPIVWNKIEPTKIVDGDITTKPIHFAYRNKIIIDDDSIISVRDYNNYKVLVYKAKKNQNPLIRGNKVDIEVKENEIYMACYYFKTIS